MADEKSAAPRAIPIERIDASRRLRPVDDASVGALAASMQAVGLLHPITVRQKPHGDYALICGGHRLAAANRLWWETIPAVVRACSEAEAELIEAEENLATAELSALDLALHLAAQKRRHLELYPQTRQGVAGGLARQGQQRTHVSAAESIAAKRGLSLRHIRRFLAVGNHIAPEAVSALRIAPKEPSYRELAALSAHPPKVQQRAAYLWADGCDGKAVSMNEALRVANEQPPEAAKDRLEVEVDALTTAWARASAKARRQFLGLIAMSADEMMREALAQAKDA